MQQKITPNLWFNGTAQEAAEFYASVFPDAKIHSTTYYPDTPEEGLADFQLELAGQPLTVSFELLGMQFVGINAGPDFAFNEAISFSIECENQDEIDYYWQNLSSVPEAEQCGWCKDQFGLSWQIVPKNMEELMSKPKAFAKLMDMKKIIIADL